MSLKLQQLRYIWEVSQNEFNVSATAERLFTSQPGISKQVRLLEEELGIPIFVRNGKHLTQMTVPGQKIVKIAEEILSSIEDIKQIAAEYRNDKTGMLSIATTHTQARYALPEVVKLFMRQYPGISLNIQQGTPIQLADLVAKGKADLVVATEGMELFDNLVMLPCYDWNRCIIVEEGHPLSTLANISLQDIVDYPVITYVSGFTGRAQLDAAFDQHNLKPRVVLTAVDADVIKTYARLGLGVGIVAKHAYNSAVDTGLVAIDASHLFNNSRTSIALRKDSFLRSYVYEFIELFAPHLTRERVEIAVSARSREEVAATFEDIAIPCY